MWPSSGVFSIVGQAAGPAGVVFLINGVVTLSLIKMKDNPNSKTFLKRFYVLAFCNLVIGIAGLISATVQHQRDSTAIHSEVKNVTTGELSPILAQNCGQVTITDKKSGSTR